jgi:C-5 cytosine-specific DNA methylase
VSDRPRLLDLFCGVGGAAWGYYQAGFDVVGVDIEVQKRYPFEFVQADAFDVMEQWMNNSWDARFQHFDAIHASPPCQAYADEGHRYRTDHPDLIEPTRDVLIASGLPWVIENVDTAPLRNPMMLCGTMFPGVRVIRHRMFESSFYMEGPPHRGKHPPVFSYDKRRDRSGLNEWDDYVTVTGGGNCGIDAARDAMGIRWATIRELNQAIPPAYTQYVGKRLLMAVDSRAAA